MRVVFEAEAGNGRNLYWVGPEEGDSIGQIVTTPEVAQYIYNTANGIEHEPRT